MTNIYKIYNIKLILTIFVTVLPLMSAGANTITNTLSTNPAEQDHAPEELFFKKDGILYHPSYGTCEIPFVTVAGLPSDTSVEIPEYVEYPYKGRDNEWHLGTFYIQLYSYYSDIYSTITSPVSINYLTLPQNLIWNQDADNRQELIDVKAFYIPSFEWAIANNFDFGVTYTDPELSDFSPTVWIGKYGDPDAEQLTQVKLPAYIDGKAYALNGAAGIESIDLSDLYDPGQITVSKLKDLDDVVLSPYAISLPIVSGCDKFAGFTPTNSVTHLSADTPLSSAIGIDNLPTALTSMGGGIFADRDITSFVMPDNLEEIGTIAFGAHLENVTVGQRVRSLNGVFSQCEYLKSVTIGSRVTSIAADEFKRCTLLTNVEVQAAEPPVMDGDAFDAVTYLFAKLYVPLGSKAKYTNTDGWRKFANIEEKEMPEQSPINRLKSTSVYTSPGEEVAIEVEVDGDTAPVLTYSVDDETIISVDENGIVTGLKEGQAVVTVTPDGKSELAVRCVVSVTPRRIDVEKIETEPMELKNGDAFIPIPYTVYPEDATIKEIEWTSSNEKIARVTYDGRVIAGTNGYATITGKALDGSGTKCTVKVGVAFIGGVDEIDTNHQVVTISNDGMMVTAGGLNEGDYLRLWTTDGVLVATAAADASGYASVRAPHAGTYIVKAADEVRKLNL